MSGISSKALNFGSPENKRKKFQGQEYNDDLGVDIYEFKYRMDDPQTGRFWQIDPLANKYVYNSTYAFSENKVTTHVELEGLEAEYIFSQLKQEVNQNFQALANSIDNAISFFTKSSSLTVVSSKLGFTQSVGTTVTTTTQTNFGGNMAYIIRNNTNAGNTNSLVNTTTTVTADTRTDVKVPGVTLINKASLSTTGVISNETGAQRNVVIEGVPTNVRGTVTNSSDGKTTVTAQGTTDIPVSIAQATAQVQYSTNGKQQSVSVGVGGQATEGKTTVQTIFGIKFSWFKK